MLSRGPRRISEVIGAARSTPGGGSATVASWAGGSVTHRAALDGRDRIGVAARPMEPAVTARAKPRHLDGAGTERYLD